MGRDRSAIEHHAQALQRHSHFMDALVGGAISAIAFEEWVRDAERRVGAVHEALHGDADICIELHRQMNPAESIALGQRLKELHPYFYEDPMLPDSPAMMGDVQARSGLPVATGGRFSSIFQPPWRASGCARS